MKIRAHHLLCIPRFRGGGYSKEAGRHLRSTCKSIRENPEKKIRVVMECDDICLKCPHFNGKICVKRKGINKIILAHDDRVLKKLGIKKNMNYEIRNIFNLSVREIGSEQLKDICKGCGFLEYCIKYGINTSFVKDINKE